MSVRRGVERSRRQLSFPSLHRAIDELRSALEAIALKCYTPDMPTPIPLCQHHYHMVYKVIKHTALHATCCNLQRSKNTLKRMLVAIVTSMSMTKCVMHATVRAHLVILKRSENVASSVSDLQQTIATLSKEVSSEATSVQEAINASMHS